MRDAAAGMWQSRRHAQSGLECSETLKDDEGRTEFGVNGGTCNTVQNVVRETELNRGMA